MQLTSADVQPHPGLPEQAEAQEAPCTIISCEAMNMAWLIVRVQAIRGEVCIPDVHSCFWQGSTAGSPLIILIQVLSSHFLIM